METNGQIADGTQVRMSGKELIFGETIFQPREATQLLDDTEALHARMEEDGYLLIRNFYDRELVMKARLQILQHMADKGVLNPGTPIEEAVIGPGNKGAGFSNKVVKRLPAFLEVVNSDRVLSFFEGFLGGKVMSLDHKWLRAVGKGRNAGSHYDIVYMGAGTDQLFTVWTALGDISLDMGPLAVCLGSHKLEKLKATYGASDAHEDLTQGWFSRDPYEVKENLGIEWASTTFKAGDVVIFGMYFMHGSLENQSDRYRLSCDTRYQLASESVDERHMGETPDQIPKAKMEDRVTIEAARTEWGL